MSSFRHRAALNVLVLDELAVLGVDAFITTRQGGVSAAPYDSLNVGLHVGDVDDHVIENRQRVADALSTSLDQMVFADQIHGARIATVSQEEAGRGARFIENALSATDGLITQEAHLPLALLVADCCPIILVEPQRHLLAVIHAGWRGTAAGITRSAVSEIEMLGGSSELIRVVIGPSIDPTRYEVGDEVVAGLTHDLDSSLIDFVDTSSPRAHVDLALANRAQLLASGVADEAITLVPHHTDDERFFSDRTARPCGRFGLFAQFIA